ncbi:MAG: hypothetical protein ACREPI_12810 [Candidatus Dormibacterales bacterium]
MTSRIVRFLRRGPGAADGAGAGPAGGWVPAGAVCEFPGCGKPATSRCSYADATGQRCGFWCPDHIEKVADLPYCRRHGNTVRVVKSRAGTIYEMKSVPTLDDRAPNLLTTLAAEMSEAVLQMLARRWGQVPGIRIQADKTVRETQVPRSAAGGQMDWTSDQPASVPGWKMGWSAFTGEGYISTVALRTTPQEPPVVQLMIDGRPVWEGVPDWIEARRQGRPDAPEDHENLKARILTTIGTHLFPPGEVQEAAIDPADPARIVRFPPRPA